jgi:hypothetical protein
LYRLALRIEAWQSDVVPISKLRANRGSPIAEDQFGENIGRLTSVPQIRIQVEQDSGQVILFHDFPSTGNGRA